jgi:hypothetical protein
MAVAAQCLASNFANKRGFKRKIDLRLFALIRGRPPLVFLALRSKPER